MSTMGRPTSYSPDLCELAHTYRLLGATNDELAEFFGVSPRTNRHLDRRVKDYGEDSDFRLPTLRDGAARLVRVRYWVEA
jgi:hypothetical protein